MADDNLMSQDEIERLLGQQPKAAGGPAKPAPTPPASATTPSLGQGEIEELLKKGGKPESPPQRAPQSPQASQSPQTPAAGDADKVLAQNDIDKLLNHSGRAAPAVKEKAAPAPREAATAVADDGGIPQGDIEFLLHQAQQALASVDSGGDGPAPPGVVQFRLEEFSGAPASSESTTLDLIRDVELDLKIELGRTHMYLEDVLRLRKGSVVPLDKLAGDPVDIYVNGRLIARGEVLVLNDNFCVRVAELISGANVGH